MNCGSMVNPTALLVLLLLACAAVRAAPPPKGGSSRSSSSSSSSPSSPPQDSSGGFFDALRTASGQLQHSSDKFPVSYNSGAMRFQSWAEDNKGSIANTATNVFNFARTILKPFETELMKQADGA
ncbi:hypothetical protein V5799_010294 [Amblyomma americanum]|uniref:Secreted protein n=1 Tax=Amblyomma americanum TaxID=6943 RepID=A0AAQ4F8E5_AMBAM